MIQYKIRECLTSAKQSDRRLTARKQKIEIKETNNNNKLIYRKAA